jgi:hypothetical protein
MPRRMSARAREPEPMAPKRHQAPSRARYAVAHPARTVRFTRQADEKLLTLAKLLDISYNQAANIIVEGLDDAAIEMIRARADEQGFGRGVKAAGAERAATFAASDAKFWLTLPCPKCGQPIEIRTASLKNIDGLLAIPEFWAHEICPSPPNAPNDPF